ncbi:MAG: hypothetical protein KA137_11815 [Halioglobus sp.]|nr:hypothetical protein [Halioglobus sp.]
MRTIIVKILAAGLLAVSIGANAATIDFSGVQGSNPSPLVLPEATFTSAFPILVGPGAASQADGFCFQPGSCAGDGEILFSTVVSNLSFDVDGWQTGDFVEIRAYNGPNLVGTLNATANSNLDFSSFGAITRLVFDDSSTASGVGYSTFLFDAGAAPPPTPGSAAPIPTMSAYGLVVTMLGLLLVASRRLRKTAGRR